MTIAKQLIEEINKMPDGKPFNAAAFRHLGKTENIRKILSRLVKSGQIVRLAHGTYCKPKLVPVVGITLPSIKEIAKSITEATGETLLVHGAEAARMLELSTQVPLKLVFYTNGNSRELKIGKRLIALKHVNPSQLICANNIAGIVISALRYLGREHVTIETIEKIANGLSERDMAVTLNNVKHMPAWMADLFYQYKQGLKDYE